MFAVVVAKKFQSIAEISKKDGRSAVPTERMPVAPGFLPERHPSLRFRAIFVANFGL
jgi:hypothetical protein